MFCFPLDLQVLLTTRDQVDISFIILSVSNGNTTSQITKSCLSSQKKPDHKFTFKNSPKKGFSFCVVVRFIDWLANHNLPHITWDGCTWQTIEQWGSPYDHHVAVAQRAFLCKKPRMCVCSQFTVKSQQQQSLKKKAYLRLRERAIFSMESSARNRIAWWWLASVQNICATPLLEVWAIKMADWMLFPTRHHFL